MTTFDTGQKTHSGVLPQPRTLEPASADNPESRNETGRRGAGNRAPGMGHGRGEIPKTSTRPAGRHPGTDVPGEGREAHHPAVFVLDKHSQPLQPTSPARARKLLKQGRAVVVRHTPFVIRLKDRTAAQSSVDGVEIGIDPGSKHTGIAIFTGGNAQRRGLYTVELTHRGDQIRNKLVSRAAYRRGRRTRNLRYRAPRFRNRTKPKGWLAPSLRHRVETTVSWTHRLARWAPVTGVHMERVAFDTHLMAAERPLNGVEYQHGTLASTEAREYLLAKWHHACAYCGASGVPLNIDHIDPWSRGGSDRITNLAVACVPCNQSKGSTPIQSFLRHAPKQLARILAQAKAPLRDAAAVNATRWALWRALDAAFPGAVRTASGGRTKWNRQRTGLPKTHTLDALCVGVMDSVAQHPNTVLTATAGGRGRYRRTDPDKYGFPRKTNPRAKAVLGFQTGDYARAVVPTGKHAGTYTGRIAVRSTGKFNIRTRHGLVQGIHHRHVRLLQRADGYAYATQEEGTS